MNQILVTKKVYVTPELKRKKNFYKVHFTISIFLIAVLAIVYLYLEFDRNRNEAVSQEVLSEINNDDNTVVDEEVLVAFLDGEIDENISQNQQHVVTPRTR